MYIKNRDTLTSHGYREGRAKLVDILDHALQAADPYRAARNLLHLNGTTLRVGHLQYDLSERGAIYLLGMGKATFPIARAIEDVLGDRLSQGLIIVKDGQPGALHRVDLRRASHPLPDQRGHMAAGEIMHIARSAQAGDLVFCAITGGSSALAPLPPNGISLADKVRVHELLLNSGATIREINAVRKHLSRIKGGKLALTIFPAELINLTVSDVIGDPLDYITGPTVPDTSTFEDALRVLHKYDLLSSFPRSAVDYLRNATADMENPRHFRHLPVHTFLLVPSDAACRGATARARELGFHTAVTSLALEGESSTAGAEFANLAADVYRRQGPVPPPCVLVAGGETTITITGPAGHGGPNQEFALSGALHLDSERAVMASIDTDGTDGPTDIAGGLVDSSTAVRARACGIDIADRLAHHDSSPVLQQLGEAVVTGHTGTNVNDLKALLVE